MTANSMEKVVTTREIFKEMLKNAAAKMRTRGLADDSRRRWEKCFDLNQIEAGHSEHSRNCANSPMAIFELFIARTSSF